MTENLRNYLVITASYWAFTLTDGAIRMLLVLFFHQLGYSPYSDYRWKYRDNRSNELAEYVHI